jgi:hypothetical protein
MVELAVTPDRRWTATTAELLAATTAAGFSALGAFAHRAGPHVRQLYDDAQVRCHEMLALVVSDDGESIRSAQALADAAAVMGAEWVLTVFSCPLTAETAPIVQRCWDGLVSVEVLSAELRALPVDEALRRLHATTAPYWL